MKTYIVLLRGVMPVGKNKVKMADLREVLSSNGFLAVETYIASGNVVLKSKLTAAETEKKVHELIKKHLGPDLVVVVRTAGQLRKLLDENPFPKSYDGSRIFYVSFASKPKKEKVVEVLSEDHGENKLKFSNSAGYMYIPGDASKSKLSNNYLEKKLDVSTTTRNFNTVTKLIEMAKQASKQGGVIL